jgi:hypothetical protein
VKRDRLRLFDLAAFLLSLLVIGALSGSAYSARSGDPKVVVEAAGTQWVYPLKADRRLRVPGPLGEELIEIANREVFVVSSPCPNKICILQGKISRPGQWIACLPNKVFIRIEDPAAADAISF